MSTHKHRTSARRTKLPVAQHWMVEQAADFITRELIRRNASLTWLSNKSGVSATCMRAWGVNGSTPKTMRALVSTIEAAIKPLGGKLRFITGDE